MNGKWYQAKINNNKQTKYEILFYYSWIFETFKSYLACSVMNNNRLDVQLYMWWCLTYVKRVAESVVENRCLYSNASNLQQQQQQQQQQQKQKQTYLTHLLSLYRHKECNHLNQCILPSEILTLWVREISVNNTDGFISTIVLGDSCSLQRHYNSA